MRLAHGPRRTKAALDATRDRETADAIPWDDYLGRQLKKLPPAQLEAAIKMEKPAGAQRKRRSERG